jgi:YHS domain-containing protein
MALDPICKMTVDESTAKFTSEFEGKTFYFCAPRCKEMFDEDPDYYLVEQQQQSTHDCTGGGH